MVNGLNKVWTMQRDAAGSQTSGITWKLIVENREKLYEIVMQITFADESKHHHDAPWRDESIPE
ncbi:unnamed protein product [Fusarium graminearum]|nr:unnamed protein product [Fusarium graminearum]